MLARCLLFSAISSLTLQVVTTPLTVRADACDRQTEAGTCNSYEECREKGVCYWRKLQTTLHSDRPVDRSDGKTLFDQYYRAEYDITQEADLELQSGFVDRGMKYDHVDLWDTLPRGGPPSRFPAYANEFDTANGVIIAQANFKRFDPHKKLEWSELMYQTWPHAQMKADELHRRHIANKVNPPHPPGSPIANLRAIVQHSAIPRGTRAVITAAYNANKDKG
ncbi:MAG: hypothetical protein LQ345_007152, partial [Seirophora villosa]